MSMKKNRKKKKIRREGERWTIGREGGKGRKEEENGEEKSYWINR